MDIVADFRAHMPLEDFPGVRHAWLSTKPNRFARLIFLPRPDGEALFQVNVKHETDTDAVREFLLFAQGNMPVLADAAPMSVAGGFRPARQRFDSAIAVIPSAAELTPTRQDRIDQRVYGLFPGWRCEVSMTESEAVANRRFRREIEYHDWTRRPSPFIAITYGFQHEGRPEETSERRLPTTVGYAESIVEVIQRGLTGWIDCENYTGRTVRIGYTRGTGLVWDAEGGQEPLPADDLHDRLWSFLTTGA